MFHSLLKRLLLAGLVAVALPALAQPSDPVERAALTAYLKDALHHEDSFKDRFDAEVWLLDMSQRLSKRLPEPEDRLALLQSVHREARSASLPPELVLALIEVESAFDRFAISRVGAQGLMQVMPFWKKEIGRPDDNLTDPDTNLRYGCQILQFYLQREKGNMRRALARYNGSLGKNWYPDRVFNAWRKRWYNGPLAYRGIDD
ncbi:MULTISPECIES: transglycosylase SLT domain-containing protein [Spongiibacter]|uniref:transglycosylase SLT domain-containing protein n=1 Tax=Spongiibacter TaxID=630749 RepID=UPI002355EE88|nr:MULTISPECIES: transglycosylase SLT domain-containing protein [Spongiibacter]